MKHKAGARVFSLMITCPGSAMIGRSRSTNATMHSVSMSRNMGTFVKSSLFSTSASCSCKPPGSSLSMSRSTKVCARDHRNWKKPLMRSRSTSGTRRCLRCCARVSSFCRRWTAAASMLARMLDMCEIMPAWKTIPKIRTRMWNDAWTLFSGGGTSFSPVSMATAHQVQYRPPQWLDRVEALDERRWDGPNIPPQAACPVPHQHHDGKELHESQHRRVQPQGRLDQIVKAPCELEHTDDLEETHQPEQVILVGLCAKDGHARRQVAREAGEQIENQPRLCI
eukprot:143885-Prymnesium_polylepis.1